MQHKEKIMENQTNEGNSLVDKSNLEPKILETYKKPKPPKTPKDPKGKRELVYEEMWDLMVLNHLAKKNITIDLASEKIETDMLSIVIRQFKTIEETETSLARALREIVELRALNQVHELFFDSIYKSFEKLDDIEMTTSKGGRKEDLKLKEFAFNLYKKWMRDTKGKHLSGYKLSQLVTTKKIK